MKYKVKIAILSFLTLFLSLLNLKHGLIFNVTDNTERDALYTSIEEKTDSKDKVKAEISQINIPKAKSTSVAASATTKKTTSTKNYDYSKITSKRIDCDSSMPETNGIYYCNYRGSSSIFAYGHNRSNVFASLANLKQNDTFTIKIDGKVKKYRVVNNFTLKLSALNPNPDTKAASELRSSLFSSTYGGKYDITLQTCAGANDSYRRYIQAVEV